MCTSTFISNKMTGKWKYLYILQMQSILINNLTNVWLPSTITMDYKMTAPQLNCDKIRFTRNKQSSQSFQECKFYSCTVEHCCCQKKFGTWKFIGFFRICSCFWNTQGCCSVWRANVLLFCYNDKPKIHLQNILDVCLFSFCNLFECKYWMHSMFHIEKYMTL